MKRISVLVCLLSVMICLLLAGCGAKENSDVSNSQYVGTWKGEKLTAAGQEVTAQEVFGGDFFLELKNDGTYVMTAGQDVTEGKWTDTDKGPKVYADNNKGAVYKVDGDTMEMDAVVAKVYLKKQ